MLQKQTVHRITLIQHYHKLQCLSETVNQATLMEEGESRVNEISAPSTLYLPPVFCPAINIIINNLMENTTSELNFVKGLLWNRSLQCCQKLPVMFSVFRAASPNLFPIFPSTSFTESIVSAKTRNHESTPRKLGDDSNFHRIGGPRFEARERRTLRGGRGAAGRGGDVGVAAVGRRRGGSGGGMVRRWRRRGHVLRREPRVRRVLRGCGGAVGSAGGRGCCGRVHVAGGREGRAGRCVGVGFDVRSSYVFVDEMTRPHGLWNFIWDLPCLGGCRTTAIFILFFLSTRKIFVI